MVWQGGDRGAKRGNDGGGDGGSKKKGKYWETAGKGRDVELGQKGFFVTAITGCESKAGRDVVGLLEAAWEEIENEKNGVKPQDSKPEAKEGEAATTADALEAELADLKKENKKEAKKFNWIRLSNGALFVHMLPAKVDAEGNRKWRPTVTELCERMMSKVAATRQRASRFLLRVFPVQDTCFASKEDIVKSIKPLIEAALEGCGDKSVPYACLFEARNNGGIKKQKMEIIDEVATLVDNKHVVNLGAPDMSLVMQVAKGTCLLAVVRNYTAYAKYNIETLGTPLDQLEAQRESARDLSKKFSKAREVVDAKDGAATEAKTEDNKDEAAPKAAVVDDAAKAAEAAAKEAAAADAAAAEALA